MERVGPIGADGAEERYAKAASETLGMLTGLFQAAQLIPPTLRAADNTLPLTVISGFLGAGKTTLVNRLLAEPGGRRIAVLVNDFGAINIDADLIRARTADTIDLTNGCACCTVAGDLTRTLVQIAQREELPDAIVLEASGIADPRGIIQVALANPSIRFDGIVALVDAEGFGGRMGEAAARETIVQQLSAADLVLVNKGDLVSAAARAAVHARLAEVTQAPRLDTVNADVPIDVVLGLNSLRTPHLECRSEHGIAFESWSTSWDAPLDRVALTAALAQMPAGIIRAKGTFCLAGEAQQTVYHRVGARDSFAHAEGAGTTLSQLVAIGPQGAVDAAHLQALFAQV